eukprot:5088663-Amphidinium_carterae.2
MASRRISMPWQTVTGPGLEVCTCKQLGISPQDRGTVVVVVTFLECKPLAMSSEQAFEMLPGVLGWRASEGLRC